MDTQTVKNNIDTMEDAERRFVTLQMDAIRKLIAQYDAAMRGDDIGLAVEKARELSNTAVTIVASTNVMHGYHVARKFVA